MEICASRLQVGRLLVNLPVRRADEKQPACAPPAGESSGKSSIAVPAPMYYTPLLAYSGEPALLAGKVRRAAGIPWVQHCPRPRPPLAQVSQVEVAVLIHGQFWGHGTWLASPPEGEEPRVCMPSILFASPTAAAVLLQPPPRLRLGSLGALCSRCRGHLLLLLCPRLLWRLLWGLVVWCVSVGGCLSHGGVAVVSAGLVVCPGLVVSPACASPPFAAAAGGLGPLPAESLSPNGFPLAPHQAAPTTPPRFADPFYVEHRLGPSPLLWGSCCWVRLGPARLVALLSRSLFLYVVCTHLLTNMHSHKMKETMHVCMCISAHTHLH